MLAARCRASNEGSQRLHSHGEGPYCLQVPVQEKGLLCDCEILSNLRLKL